MALQSSGAISLNDIATEFGGSTPHSLSEYYGVASGIPSSGTISISQFYGKSNTISFSVSFNQCVDHYMTIYYDGNGNFRFQSREPSGNIHSGRGDCGGNQQGDITRYSFTTGSYSSMSGSVTYSGRNGNGTYTFSSWGVNSTNGPHNLGFTDGSGGAATYSFTFSGTIS